MQNHPEFVDLMVASSILGTVFVPIDPRTRGDKLNYMLEFCRVQGRIRGRPRTGRARSGLERERSTLDCDAGERE